MARTISAPPAHRTPTRSSRESNRPQTTRLYPTKNDLPETSRVEAIDLLNQRLADCIDLQTQCKQAHWNVKGPTFIALHKLFDEVNEDVEEYVDLIAERIVQLGGIAEGTARIVAERSALIDYPLGLSTGEEQRCVSLLSVARHIPARSWSPDRNSVRRRDWRSARVRG